MEVKQEISYNYYPVSLELDMGEATPENPLANTPAVAIDNANITPAAGGSVLKDGYLQSPNFVDSIAGWQIGSNGIIKAIGAIISGTITAIAGLIGGWAISATAIYKDGATDNTSAGMAPADYPFYAGKKYADRATAPLKVEPSGKLTASDIVATGTINAQAGYLGNGVYIDTVNGLLVESEGLNVGTAGHIRGGQTDYNTGTGFFLGYSTTYKFSIGVSTGEYLTWDGTNLTVNATKIIANFTNGGMAITAGQGLFIYSDGKVYPTNAFSDNYMGDFQASSFIGFAYSSAAANAAVPIQTFGIFSGLSGLTAGTIYYLSNATNNGLVNIATTDSTVALGTSEAQYQSFTTGASTTNMYRITFYFGTEAAGTMTVKIREGTGVGGALVDTWTGTITGGSGSLSVYSANYTPLSPSTVYSICPYSSAGGTTLEQDTANPYAGGRNDQNASYDYKVQIFEYTNNTLGTIGTSPGTFSKKIGIALSSTTLQILNS